MGIRIHVNGRCIARLRGRLYRQPFCSVVSAFFDINRLLMSLLGVSEFVG
jgi:hypothetical protein